jgi:hypothetical protein
MLFLEIESDVVVHDEKARRIAMRRKTYEAKPKSQDQIDRRR